jgi:hypothetical protein
MPWLIEWREDEKGPEHTVTELAETPAQAELIMRRLLTGQTFTSDFPTPRTELAFETFFRDYFQDDIEASLNALDTLLCLPCDGDGVLFIERIA